MSKIGFPTMTPQDFQTMNRGDMFFPSITVDSGQLLANVGAFDLTCGRIVKSIPVTYLMPNAAVRPHAPIGKATPAVGANLIGGR